MIKIGRRIKQARNNKRITQDELAHSIGISDKSISAYESDRIDPPLQILEKIAETTGQPMSYFIEEKVESSILAKLNDVERQFKEIKSLLKKYLKPL